MSTTVQTCARSPHPCVSRRNFVAAGGAIGVLGLAACANGDAAPEDTATTSGSGDGAVGEAIASVADIPVGGAIAATNSAGDAILITQPTEGEIYAFTSICTHQGCTVEPGEGELSCPCHGSIFDLATGAATQGPATEPLAAVSITVDDAGQIAG